MSIDITFSFTWYTLKGKSIIRTDIFRIIPSSVYFFLSFVGRNYGKYSNINQLWRMLCRINKSRKALKRKNYNALDIYVSSTNRISYAWLHIVESSMTFIRLYVMTIIDQKITFFIGSIPLRQQVPKVGKNDHKTIWVVMGS